MTTDQISEMAWALVRTWRDVDIAKLGKSETRYTPGVLDELHRDAVQLIQRYAFRKDGDKIEVVHDPQDFGLAVRNAGDTVLRGGNSFACITRLDIEQELHTIASARLASARTALLLGNPKAKPIERVSGADFVDSGFPVLWKQWRDNGSDDLIFPPLWTWDTEYEDEGKHAMPVIRERLSVLMKSDEHSHRIENAKRYVIHLFNDSLRIAVESAKVPPVYMGGLGSRSNWDDAMLAELAAKIERYNYNRIEKIRFDVKASILRAKAQCACYYYGLLTFEQ